MTAELEQPIPPALALDDEPFDDAVLDGALELELDEEVSEDARAAVAHVVTWYPTDRGAAEWAMRKVVEHQRNLDEITQQAADWQARIDRWHEQMVEKVSARASFFRVALIRYGLEERERDPKGPATIPLPSGDVVTTSRKARPKVLDREAAARSAIGNLDADDRAAVVDVPPMPAPRARANELAKRVRIVEQVQQRTFDVELDGEPRVLVRSTVTLNGEPPVVGESWPYDDGFETAERTVLALEEVESERVTQQLVVWADTGQPVEGVTVEPGRIDVSIVPR